MNTYVNREVNGSYADFPFQLDENYQQGTTWTEYINGVPAPWVLLSSEHLAFRETHPEASVQEVFEMKLNEEPEPPIPPVENELEVVKQQRLAEIKAQDEFSNKFFVSVTSGGIEIKNEELWISSGLRTTLLNSTLPALILDNETWATLWTEDVPRKEIRVPIEWAMRNIPLLEIYAKRTYDRTARNQNAVDAATTIEELVSIDVKADYPKFLTFELNLDNYASNHPETIS